MSEPLLGTGGRRRCIRAAAAGAVAAGAAVLAGWGAGSETAKALFPGLVPMNPVTAVGFILGGGSLWLHDAPRAGLRLAARLAAAAAAALASLRLAGYLLSRETGVDRWLFTAALDAPSAGIPNRMAPNTAACLLLCGLALLVLGPGRRRALLAQGLAAAVAGVATLTLLGYAYGARQFTGVAMFIPMAANTALAFLVLACGLMAAAPQAGITRLLTDPGAAGQTARRMLPVAFAVPAAAGWLSLRGQAAGLYRAELGISLVVTAVILAFVAVIAWNALLLREAYAGLESRVRERTADLAAANERLTREGAERAKLQAQLTQSQKMDAVGRLAGGIAHDFNNLLTAIRGYSHFLLEGMPAEDPRRQDVEEIDKAGARAAELTRRLLAFSRQQVLQPRVIDCRALVSDMEKMLKRIIGEETRLRSLLPPDARLIRADPGQIEQAILNLVVNARDAMPRGGEVVIEVSAVDLDDEYARMHLQVKPGRYVMLAVADTGAGMDARTQEHLFEPFFTTKEPGKGTGLGLATVYGVVQQSGGGIYVYSEPGHGTVFKLYFPLVERAEEAPPASPARARPAGGEETILLVEDDEMVRRFVHRVLTGKGYSVLVAKDPDEALALAAREGARVRLVLTDVIMPRLRGPELAERLAPSCPRARALFMSGYTDTAVVQGELLDGRARFLQKPLSAGALLSRVREVLDEGVPG